MVNELREMQDEVISIKRSITSSFHKCTLVRKDLTQFNAFIQKIGNDRELCFLACKKCEQNIQQALTVLGKSNNVLIIQEQSKTIPEQSKHNVRISSDIKETCGITNICVLPTGQVLVADWWNNNVKLLNQQYQVVSHCGVAAHAEDMCLITPSKVAVTVNDDDNNIHEVQFVTVNNSMLVTGRKLRFQHRCISTAHHEGDLFVTSGTALFKYTLGGKQVSKLYVDDSKEDSGKK
ncbi:hypothetical protein DPMN_157023 [Dreissena polymorpha]|uniref:Uncharacterized protein n=1 Tax=Dreissena polymorpha TaxID=45954 RepID=A0A9D4FPZ8_DREPO|nr:hypothetical protein DPMN_157023 [Dreissena polymorpha]